MPPIESSEMDTKPTANGILGQILSIPKVTKPVENRTNCQYSIVTETLFGQQALKQEFFKNAKERAPDNTAMDIFF